MLVSFKLAGVSNIRFLNAGSGKKNGVPGSGPRARKNIYSAFLRGWPPGK